LPGARDQRSTRRGKGFSSRGSGYFDPANGDILWHAGLADDLSNGPETYMLDGQQYLVVGAGDSLYAFTVEE
jgi:alcohol dehydrogenase (cytochrome c)